MNITTFYLVSRELYYLFGGGTLLELGEGHILMNLCSGTVTFLKKVIWGGPIILKPIYYSAGLYDATKYNQIT